VADAGRPAIGPPVPLVTPPADLVQLRVGEPQRLLEARLAAQRQELLAAARELALQHGAGVRAGIVHGGAGEVPFQQPRRDLHPPQRRGPLDGGLGHRPAQADIAHQPVPEPEALPVGAGLLVAEPVEQLVHEGRAALLAPGLAPDDCGGRGAQLGRPHPLQQAEREARPA
jgi:hypothetical protein